MTRMYEVKTAEFVKGIKGTDSILYDGRPQIAFVGRSNVGKSSAINTLLGRKNLVKSSSTPGKTKELNFFLINDERYIVDLPGYGFARLSQKDTEKMQKMILWYLADSGVRPVYVVLVVDAKVGPTDLDREMMHLLIEEGHNPVVIATKLDKIKKNDRISKRKSISKDLGDVQVILYSAETKEGREELLETLFGK